MKLSLVVPFLVGLVFALGLGLGGMTDPAVVLGFLDITGRWDPRLLFVMVGAVGVHLSVYFLWIRRRDKPLLHPQFHWPTKIKIEWPLVVGSALFGIGWGLGGYCPGPGLVGLSSMTIEPWVFVISMVVGMLVFRLMNRVFKW